MNNFDEINPQKDIASFMLTQLKDKDIGKASDEVASYAARQCSALRQKSIAYEKLAVRMQEKK